MLFPIAVARGYGCAGESSKLSFGHHQWLLRDSVASGGAFDAQIGREARKSGEKGERGAKHPFASLSGEWRWNRPPPTPQAPTHRAAK